MPNLTKLLFILSLCFCLTVLHAFRNTQAQSERIVPEKNVVASQLIRISYITGITRENVTVKPGTTVIWLNDSRASLYLEFTDKQVTIACKSPVHFIVDEETGTFISNRIPMGAVASLCFIEKGEFVYKVKRASPGAFPAAKPQEFTGKIIVE